MNFQDAIVTCLKKYVEFNGRASRSEYWWFVLFQLIVIVVLNLIYAPLSTLASLALLLPSIMVSIRRLHDVDKSGWFLLLAFIPLIGALVLLFWYVQEGTKGTNKFGPEPMKS